MLEGSGAVARANDSETATREEKQQGQRRAVAILVIHGIGRQQRFQPLDSFANGLRPQLGNPTPQHLMRVGPDKLEHFVRLEGHNSELTLDIYEFYWAHLKVARTSIFSVLLWLLTTGIRPLRGFASNIHLLLERIGQSRPTIRSLFTTSLSGNGYLFRVFGAELLRSIGFFLLLLLVIVAVPVALTLLAILSASDLTVRVRSVDFNSLTWIDAGTSLLAAVLSIGLGTLLCSLPQQFRDFVRVVRLTVASVPQADPGGYLAAAVLMNILSGERVERWWRHVISITKGDEARRGALERLSRYRAYSDAASNSAHWNALLRSYFVRATFLATSLLGVSLFAVALHWLLQQKPLCEFGTCVSPIVATVYERIGWGPPARIVLAVVSLLFLKRILVDYLGDVALYTTRDETSPFAQTRRDVLEEATRTLRELLRDYEDYEGVVIAGHSLGSVIGYDVINRLAVEARVDEHLSRERESEPVEEQEEEVQASQLTTVGDLERMRVFITFGSPLNKILYLFRTRVETYEPIRAEILDVLNRFRRPWKVEFATTENPAEWGRASESGRQIDEILSGIRWLNVYALLDFVSARLVYYSQIYEYRRWFLLPGLCHMSYWHDPRFYEEVLAAIQERTKRARLRQ